jgi:hypothetical protein
MNTTEWVAALTTLSSVIMLSKGKIAGWILGILGSFFYVTIFFEQNLFAMKSPIALHSSRSCPLVAKPGCWASHEPRLSFAPNFFQMF